MKKSKAQISVEYVVISAVAISIAMGGWYMVQDSLDGYQDKIQMEKLDTLVSQILSSTEEVVYLGEGAKKTIDAEIPERLQTFEVVVENSTYYIHARLNTSVGIQDRYYEMPVQLRLTKTCND